MADDTEVSVKIAADASGVQDGADAAKGAVSGIADQTADTAQAVQAHSESIGASLMGVSNAVASHIGGMGESLEGVTSKLASLAAPVMAALDPFAALGMAALNVGQQAVQAYGQMMAFADQIGSAGEKVQNTARTLGMTTGEVQKLQTVFTAAGAGPDALGGAMSSLNAAASQAASGQKGASEAFKQIGVDLTQARTPAELMQVTLQGFANMADGPAKASAATAIFGNDMQKVGPIIGLTKDQLAAYNEQAAKYGTVNEEAVGRAAALGQTMNENKNAMAGVQNVLADALAPVLNQVVGDVNGVIAAFTQSYTSGGLVRQIMDLIAVTASAVGTVFSEIGRTIGVMWRSTIGQTQDVSLATALLKGVILTLTVPLVAVGTAVRILFEGMGLQIAEAKLAWTTLGKVIADAMGGHWDRIAADLKAGLDKNLQLVKEYAKKVAGEGTGALDKINQIRNGGDRKQEPSPKSVPLTIKPADVHKPKTGVTPPPAIAALAPVSSASVATAASPADAPKIAQAEAGKTAKDNLLSDYQEQIAAAKNSWDTQKALVDAYMAYVDGKYKQDSDQYRSAEHQKATVYAQHGHDAEGGIDKQESQVQSKSSKGQIAPDQALTQFKALEAQRVAIATQTEDDLDAIERGRLTRDGASQDQMAAQAKVHAANLDQIAQSSATRIAGFETASAGVVSQAWARNVGSLVQTFGSGLLDMARHGTSFTSVMLKVGESVENMFASSVEKMVTDFILGEAKKQAIATASQAAQTGATVEGSTARLSVEQGAHAQSLLMDLQATLVRITNAAASAAAKAFTYFADMGPLAIPLGAAAAAVTFTAVEAFGALASASGGYDIGNENPLTQLHAQEMVLPASIATPLRGMIAANSNGAGGGSGGSSGGGDTYNMAINALDSRSLKRTMNNPGNVRAAAGAFAKHG